MNRRCLYFVSTLLLFYMYGLGFIFAQNTPADYERAFNLQEKYTNQVLNSTLKILFRGYCRGPR